MSQIPLGPAHLKCPHLNKPMIKVCHTCPFWMKLQINDANGNPIDEWKCKEVWDTLLAYKMCQETSAVGVEVNELRNETKKAHDESVTMAAIATQRASDAVRSTVQHLAGIKSEGGAIPLVEMKSLAP